MKHQATPYLTFNGEAEEALDYYTHVFQGEVTGSQTFGEADFETPPGLDNRIMHAHFQKGSFSFMVSDSFLDQSVNAGNNISLALELEDKTEIQTLYDRLSEKGTILMELQDTFWNATFAKVKDKYGIIWDLNYTHE
ncbi:VOC family protein [Halobacillus sp. K22]|uniref:VOC family protein n=1 Tax=Halobacillus sp. K22 TaxID=3457431 RepID=UPI003FCDBA5B